VTPTQTDFRGPVDDELVGGSKRRKIIYTTSRFAALPLILRRSAVIATVPQQPARQWADAFGLTSSPVPVHIASFAISAIWHAKREGDAGLQWLRGVVRQVVEAEMSQAGSQRSVPSQLRPDRRSRQGRK
jgi:LysR family transcriptional regulator, mexEF-oprN operon transcriptional activator